MKKTLLLALSLGCFSYSMAIGFGVHAGANFSNLKVSATDGTTSVSGSADSVLTLTGGAYLEVPMAAVLYLQPELNYTKFNTGLNGNSSTNPATYLTVPLLLKAKFSGPGISPYAVLGPSLGFKIGGDGYKSTNIGLDFGAGAEFSAAPTLAITLDVRYHMGLSSIADTTSGSASVNLKTQGLYLLGGVAFAI